MQFKPQAVLSSSTDLSPSHTQDEPPLDQDSHRFSISLGLHHQHPHGPDSVLLLPPWGRGKNSCSQSRSVMLQSSRRAKNDIRPEFSREQQGLAPPPLFLINKSLLQAQSNCLISLTSKPSAGSGHCLVLSRKPHSGDLKFTLQDTREEPGFLTALVSG